MKWTLLQSPPMAPFANMERDRQLLEGLAQEQKPILHLYEWEGDCATYGHFVSLEKWVDLEAAKRLELNLARRPTGGGIVFHLTDLAFSVLLPASHPEFSLNTLCNYQWVNKRVVKAIERFSQSKLSLQLLPTDPTAPSDCTNFCMAKPTIYDIVVDDQRKVGGAAQRRTRHGFLHQGTIALAPLCEEYLRQVLSKGVVDAMKANSFYLLPPQWTQEELLSARQTLRHHLIEAFLT